VFNIRTVLGSCLSHVLNIPNRFGILADLISTNIGTPSSLSNGLPALLNPPNRRPGTSLGELYLLAPATNLGCPSYEQGNSFYALLGRREGEQEQLCDAR